MQAQDRGRIGWGPVTNGIFQESGAPRRIDRRLQWLPSMPLADCCSTRASLPCSTDAIADRLVRDAR
jgi:hypothetical protein